MYLSSVAVRPGMVAPPVVGPYQTGVQGGGSQYTARPGFMNPSGAQSD
jgi:hypothetical protein